jgi:hypothetical protein
MPIRIEVHSGPSYIEAVYVAPLADGEMGAAAGEVAALARRHGTSLRLADCTALGDTLTMADLFEFAGGLVQDPVDRSIRDAVVLSRLPFWDEALRLWESACLGRGLIVCTFYDRESALAWLLEHAAPSPAGRSPEGD